MSLATIVLAAAAGEEGGGSDLISPVPGLMIWTLVTFAIVFFVLRRLAFGRIQGMIDERRDRIRQALDEARRLGQQQAAQAREQAQADLERRLEENQRAIEAENRKLREQIRRDVVELTLLASEKVTGKVLDAEDQRRLIDETIQDIDVKRIASDN